MKVKDLVNELDKCKLEYGDSFLDWDVYTEQIDEVDKESKRTRTESNGEKWGIVKDSEDWEYFECAGFWTKFPEKKIFTVNVNF